jgi:hypothetical protein
MNLLRRLLARLTPRPRLAVARPITGHKQGAVLHTHTGLAVHFTLFGGGWPPAPTAPRRKPPTGTRLTNALLGPPTRSATLAEVRRRSVDTLTAAQAVTGQTYPTRHEVLAARQTAARRAVDGAARVVAPRLAKQSTMQAPGRKPIKVKAHTRADGTKVHAHTRAVPGKGTK